MGKRERPEDFVCAQPGREGEFLLAQAAYQMWLTYERSTPWWQWIDRWDCREERRIALAKLKRLGVYKKRA